MPPLLHVNRLSTGYSTVPVLHDVSLTVNALETVSVLGANGAGKTTLVRAIVGLLRPFHGAIIFDGEDVTSLKPEELARRGLSLVPQGRSVFPHMSVQENLEMGSYLVRDRSSVRERLATVFDLFPILKERQHQLAGAMSGGEQKMLEIGRSLMLPLKLLILDEPSLGLAPILVATIFDRIQKFNRAGLTVLLVEQNAFGALRISGRAYVLELGRIGLEDTSERLLANPEIRAHYLGTSPT